MPITSLVLVDGEHHPPVVRAAIEALRGTGRRVVAAALLGGGEKLERSGQPDYGVERVVQAASPLESLLVALDVSSPDEIVDLSDEPVLDSRDRLLLAAHALRRGVPYRGADFALEPPPRPRLAAKPSLAVVGTGKRTGKTAITGAAARALAARGRPPVVVAMGRGGPAEPELVDPTTTDLTPRALLARAEAGGHAASDHLEDAVTAGIVTVGTRRCGGGLAGAPGPNTFAAGVALGGARPESLLLFEGSGAAVPPAHADATVLVVPEGADPELVCGYLGPYLMLLADLVVITLRGESPPESLRGSGGGRSLESLVGRIRAIVPGIPVLRTILRPWPLSSIAERPVFFVTTAPGPVAARLAAHLESEHRATVVGWTDQLADRERLAGALAGVGDAEVLVTELKAAAVDVAIRAALERGMEVVFCDNRPAPAGPGGDEVDTALVAVADLAARRFAAEQP